jgi:hypothetical protein
MKRPPRLRFGGLLVAFGLVLWACDGDDTPPSFFDGGGDATADVANEASDASEAGPTTHAKLIVVHASPDVAAFRMCFALGVQNDGTDAQMDPIPPLPSTATSPGAGAILPDFGDLSQQAVTPYVIVASKITSAAPCDQLVKSLTANIDYYPLPTIKRFTFAPGTTSMIALTGCLASALDGLADTTTCGVDYNAAKGNLALQIFSLDRVITNTLRFGAQLAHVATAANGVWSGQFGATQVGALLHPFDGGADEIIVDQTTLFTLSPTSAASLAMPTVDTTAFVVSAVNPDGGTSPAQSSVPLPLVYEATTGQATGENTYFAPGVNYTFVFLGDPRQPTTMDGGAFNGYSLHALAFPNDPKLPQ